MNASAPAITAMAAHVTAFKRTLESQPDSGWWLTVVVRCDMMCIDFELGNPPGTPISHWQNLIDGVPPSPDDEQAFIPIGIKINEFRDQYTFKDSSGCGMRITDHTFSRMLIAPAIAAALGLREPTAHVENKPAKPDNANRSTVACVMHHSEMPRENPGIQVNPKPVEYDEFTAAEYVPAPVARGEYPKPVEYDEFAMAADAGDIDALIRIRKTGAPWNRNMCGAAAGGGHLPALKWLRAHGCPWGAQTWLCAFGHIHVLKWLYEDAHAPLDGQMDIECLEFDPICHKYLKAHAADWIEGIYPNLYIKSAKR